MVLKDNYQYRQAMELLKIGLQNGTIKLLGAGLAVDALNNASADAAYIIALLQNLASVLPGEDRLPDYE